MNLQEALNYLQFRLTEVQNLGNIKEIQRYEKLIQAFCLEHNLSN